jgi:hypothetical protein
LGLRLLSVRYLKLQYNTPAGPGAAGRAAGSVHCVQPGGRHTKHGSAPALASPRPRGEVQRPPGQRPAEGGQCTEGRRAEEEEVEIVLALAEEHLQQAGSLLSSVGRGRGGGVQGAGPALARDIDTSIGRLEETRRRVDTAIEIYRAVQERCGRWSPAGPAVTFQATVNVEHRVRRPEAGGMREAVVTRTSGRAGRRAGQADDRRTGQVWPGLGGGPSPQGESPPPSVCTALSPFGNSFTHAPQSRRLVISV